MIISLIGMSGCGKSFWSKRLASLYKFQRYACDDLIASKLNAILDSTTGAPAASTGIKHTESSTRRISDWMGDPGSENSEAHQAIYLATERTVMQEVLNAIASTLQSPHSSTTVPNIVIDTTGSLIYTGEEVTSALKSMSRVLLFDSSADEQETMLRKYLANPKPIIWNGHFCPTPQESYLQSLERAFRSLMVERKERYRELADCIIPFDVHHSSSYTVEQLLEDIEDCRYGVNPS